MATTTYHLSFGPKHSGEVEDFPTFEALSSWLVEQWEDMTDEAEGTSEEEAYQEDLALLEAATTVEALNSLFQVPSFSVRSEVSFPEGGPREVTTSVVKDSQEARFEVVTEEDSEVTVYSASELREYIKDEAPVDQEEEVEAAVDAATDEELPALLSRYSNWGETATLL